MSEVDPAGPLAVLRRVRQPKALLRPGERCELCAIDIADEHGHVVDLDNRGLLCTCRPCTLLFTKPGAAQGRFRAVPDRYVALAGFSLAPGQWDALQIPVSVAFFFHNSVSGETSAFYPSPAGATQSLLSLDAWDEIVAANPVLVTVEADVEAVLIRNEGNASACFVVPIDACYELVGHLRRLWRGFDGGQEVHAQMAAFFAAIESKSRTVTPDGHDG